MTKCLNKWRLEHHWLALSQLLTAHMSIEHDDLPHGVKTGTTAIDALDSAETEARRLESHRWSDAHVRWSATHAE